MVGGKSMTRKQERINAGNNFINMHDKIKRLEAEVKRKEFKIRELKKSQQEDYERSTR